MPERYTNLPRFEGDSWDDHVNEWITASKSLEEHLWYLGAIAASITRGYGDRAIPEFAEAVNYSARRVWELAATYKAWEYRDRAHDLTFKHHTIAARSEDPEEAIDLALCAPKPLSTRELAATIKKREQSEVGKSEVAQTVDCPTCQGSGKVPIES